MKVLLDANVDVHFRDYLVGHDVFTVSYLGWKGTKNGALIARAAAEGFEAIVTTDRGIHREQNLSKLPLALIVVFAPGNEVDDLEPFAPNILKVLRSASPGKTYEVRL